MVHEFFSSDIDAAAGAAAEAAAGAAATAAASAAATVATTVKTVVKTNADNHFCTGEVRNLVGRMSWHPVHMRWCAQRASVPARWHADAPRRRGASGVPGRRRADAPARRRAAGPVRRRADAYRHSSRESSALVC